MDFEEWYSWCSFNSGDTKHACREAWNAAIQQERASKPTLVLPNFNEKDEGAFRYWADCNSEPSSQLSNEQAFTEGRRYEHSTMCSRLNAPTVCEGKCDD